MSSKPIAKPITDNKFPEKPITFIVPFSAGGGSDLLARSLEKVSAKHFGKPLVVINKPGGAGVIGWNELTASSPDGYTLGIIGTEIMLHPLYGSTKYHYLTSLEPIAQISNSPFVMIVRADQPWQNVHDLIQYATQYPGKLKFGHSGVGSMPHIVGEVLKQTANINIEQVPFRGGSETIAALLGKHIEITFLNPQSLKEQIKSGTVRALAVSSKDRLADPDLAQIPTFKEQGIDIVFSYRYGIAAPKGLSPEVEIKLAEGFKAMISDPEFKKSLDALGVEIEYLGPKENQDQWIADNEKLGKIVQEAGILDKIKAQKN